MSSGSELKKRANAYPKTRGSVYRNVKEQNKFLMKMEKETTFIIVTVLKVLSVLV